MTLGQKQRKHMLHIAMLISWAYNNGYELTAGDAYRDARSHGKMGQRVAYGQASSNHKIRLAHDFNLFVNGKYQRSNEAHRPLGEYWESLDSENVWGGRFGDGNHYSTKHNGRM